MLIIFIALKPAAVFLPSFFSHFNFAIFKALLATESG